MARTPILIVVGGLPATGKSTVASALARRTGFAFVRVDRIGPDAVQPLYNLDVAGSRTFFAGGTIHLVHDNTLPDHRLKPFDALPVVEVATRPE